MSTTLSGSTGTGENTISITSTGGTIGSYPNIIPLTGSVDPNYPYTGSI